MSFRCAVCNKPQPAGAAPVVIVTKTRKRKYNIANGVSLGCETETEVKACKGCAKAIETPKEENFSMGTHAPGTLRHNMRFEEKDRG